MQQKPLVPRQAREHWAPIEVPRLKLQLPPLQLMAAPWLQLHHWAPEQEPSLGLSQLLLLLSELLPRLH